MMMNTVHKERSEAFDRMISGMQYNRLSSNIYFKPILQNNTNIISRDKKINILMKTIKNKEKLWHNIHFIPRTSCILDND